jgi:NAD(P) transhydrogenase subunit beta
MTATIINLTYIVSASLFIFGLKMLSSPRTARLGNLISAFGMLLAIVVTLLGRGIVDFRWIGIGLFAGGIIGFFAARLVAMTSMPEMVALFNGFGGIASLLVGWSVFHVGRDLGIFQAITVPLTVLIGGVTFSGSFIAFAKLAGLMPGKPLLFPGQQIINILLLAGAVAMGVLFGLNSAAGYSYFLVLVGISLVLGITFVIPIGGADMPVVISLLNSYSGLAACAAGFVIQNNVLIVSGALVGASGLILTNIMCKAMNRSLPNVLFSGFGAIVKSEKGIEGEVKPINVPDAFLVLEAARSVCIVPGYGMAVAQAQHVVRELGDLLEANGADVRYAIHPVAGRMPGHMNVLLAEANVPYDKLFEMDEVNPIIDTIDVCLVIGANDVVNPAAREDESSVIYGMPIINVDFAKTVFVLKRSMSPGFAGIANPLFYNNNTRMLFGDGKASVQELIAEFKNL